MRALAETIKLLHDSEINCGIQIFYDGANSVWLGDDMNGRIIAEDSIAVEDMGQWLHDNALQQYPNSAYAKSFGPGENQERSLKEGDEVQ